MRRSALVATIVACTTSAWADTGDPLPSLTFQADASGKGSKLKAGFDLAFGKGPLEAVISPFFEATTDSGIAQLFVLDSKDVSSSNAWTVGAVASFYDWPPGEPVRDSNAGGYSGEFMALFRAAYRTCAGYCTDPKTKSSAGPFCDARDKAQSDVRTQPDPATAQALKTATDAEAAATAAEQAAKTAGADEQAHATAHAMELRSQATAARIQAEQRIDDTTVESFELTNLCPAVLPSMRAYVEHNYDRWASIPSQVLQVGVKAGATVNKYLQPDGSDHLSLLSPTHSTEAIGVMALEMRRGWSLELPAIGERKFALATSKTAKWCVLAGNVVAKDQSMAPAQTCDEQPIGPLRRHYTVHAQAIASRFFPESFWRIGIGPSLTYAPKVDGETSNTYKVGIVMPLYIGTNLLNKKATGLIRMTLGVFASQDADGTTDRSFTVSIAILSATTLFPSVFDQF